MKAIVLTFDKYLPFADHMIQCYQDIWPNNPFVFRVPYQSEHIKSYLLGKYGNKVEMIQSPSGIVDTVYTLIKDLPDNELVFWCMDDRYPIELNVKELEKLHTFVTCYDNSDISAMLFISEPYCWSPNNIYMDEYKIKTEYNQVYLRRKWYRMIWNHQYMRVGFIKYWFSHFPKQMKQAKIMDEILLTMVLPEKYKLYLTKDDYGVYGESTSRGKITQNAIESFCKKNIMLPEDFEKSNMYKIQGVTSYYKKLLYYYSYDLKCLFGIKKRSNF